MSPRFLTFAMEVPLLRRRIEVDLYEEILSSCAKQFGFSRLTDDQREAISALLSEKMSSYLCRPVVGSHFVSLSFPRCWNS